MTTKTRIAAIFIVALALFAQGPVPKPTQFGFTGEWGPALIPTTATNLLIAQPADSPISTKTFYITQITLTEQSGTADTCYVVDRQSTPVGLFGLAAAKMTFPASSTTMMVAPAGRKMVGGLTWACTNGTVSAHVVYGY